MADHPNFIRFRELWDSGAEDVGAWIRNVSDGFYNLQLQGLEWRVAAFLGVPLAELVSVLKLAALSDQELAEVSKKNPPKVFWLQLAEAQDTDELSAILDLFENGGARSPTMVSVEKSLGGSKPKSFFELVKDLSGDDFWFLASKAKKSDVTQPNERSLLASCAKRRSEGVEISVRQTKWAADIVQRLIDSKTISDSEFDEDREKNLQILSKLQIL